MAQNSDISSHDRSFIIGWTVLGTLLCLLVSLSYNWLAFGDLGRVALQRSLVSAALPPFVFGAPLFFMISTRLRGLSSANRQLNHLANTDSLTACLNRGAFSRHIDALLTTPQPTQITGALLMIDADNFKAINDKFGHDNGDEALRIIVRSIRAVLRSNDIIGRMGGEEFAVYLPDVTLANAAIIAERIRRAVNLAVFVPHTEPRQLSVSIGGTAFTSPTSFTQLFRQADHHLYEAKNSGRNRIKIAQASNIASIIAQTSIAALPPAQACKPRRAAA